MARPSSSSASVIVNAGSISQTAVRLHMPKATLSRKLRQLEQQIGAVLLKRGPHKLEMTEVGQALHQHCERIAEEAKAEGCLQWPPTDMPDPVGYICAITDPDGNVIEISHNQGVYDKAQEVWGKRGS